MTMVLAMSIITVRVYGLDKLAAVVGGKGSDTASSDAASPDAASPDVAALGGASRVRETRLHLLEVFGGWPGAVIAQRGIRHKSVKRSYRRVFFSLVTLHLGLFAAVLWFVLKDRFN